MFLVEKNSEEEEGEKLGLWSRYDVTQERRFGNQFRGKGSVTIHYYWYKNLNVNRMGFMGFMDIEEILMN